MRIGHTFAFPEDQAEERQKARKLAWLSIVLLLVAGTFIFMTVGQSQSMKTAWVSDILTAVPPVSLIVAMKFELKAPSKRFPYGYFRSIAIAFLVTASVLTITGVYLLYDSLMKLFMKERPAIGLFEYRDYQIWHGWLMIAALAFSMSIGMLLGKLKQPIAEKLHDKELEAESKMNRAEWMSEGAAILGILLVGFGFWWGDAAAAAFISVEIIMEGWENVRGVIGDLMDESPTVLGDTELEKLPEKLTDHLKEQEWIGDAAVRLREQGRVLTGDVFVVPRDADQLSASDLISRINDTTHGFPDIDWRLHALTFTPVESIECHDPPVIGANSRSTE